MKQKGSFWNWYKMMGIIKAFKCYQNLYQVVVCPYPGAFFSNDNPGLTLNIFMTGSTLFPMLLYGWQLIEHWVILYFQVCSNSAYPQHSGERYWTNGPLVWSFGTIVFETLLFGEQSFAQLGDVKDVASAIIPMNRLNQTEPTVFKLWMLYFQKELFSYYLYNKQYFSHQFLLKF